MDISIIALQNVVSVIWIVLFVVMLVGVVVMSRYGNQYANYISRNHPKLWDVFRAERVVGGEAGTQAGLLRFLMKREYLKQDDEYLEGKGEALRRLLILYFAICTVFFLSTIFLFIDVK